MKLEGFKELNSQLAALGAGVGGKVLRRSVAASLTPIAKDARNRAKTLSVTQRPHRTYLGRLVAPGFLARSIRRSSVLSKDKKRAEAYVGVAPEAFYGLQFVELGYTPWTSRKKVPARKWMRSAFDAKINESLELLKQKMSENIDKVKTPQ